MEVPPSYSQATTQDHWSIIYTFVASQDLCSAALVCQRWNAIFMPKLWGNPASHFGTENDAVYTALTRFKNTLSWARLSTRELTHTMILPPAQVQIYDGPKANWLQTILMRLPRLQSLTVSGISSVDQKSLSHLALPMQRDYQNANSPGMYSLRLLEASSCVNATSTGLLEALSRLPNLVYLDLSATLSARHPIILNQIADLQHLQILKLRGIGLKNEDMALICDSTRLRVRSLDVRDNRLTDDSVRMIIQACVITTSAAKQIIQNRFVYSQGLPISMQNFFGIDLPSVYRTENQDSFVKKTLTSGFHNHLAMDDASLTGITHLWISGNQISVQGVSNLLSMKRLHVLDSGTIRPLESYTGKADQKLQKNSYEIQNLIPLLEHNTDELTYLRLNHSIVTEYTTTNIEMQIAELDASPAQQPTTPEISVLELPANEIPIQELASEPVFELEGSPIPDGFSGNDSTNDSMNDVTNEATNDAISKSGPIIATSKTIEPHQRNSNCFSIDSDIPNHSLLPSPLYPIPRTINSMQWSSRQSQTNLPSPLSFSHSRSSDIVSPLQSPNPIITLSTSEKDNNPSPLLRPPSPPPPPLPSRPKSSSDLSVVIPTPRPRSYSGILQDHDARISFQKSQPHGLLPCMIPSLQTLVLTDIPSHCLTARATGESTASRLIDFIRACAEEAHWSRLRGATAYALPPGRSSPASRGRYALRLFALRRLVLEVRRVSVEMLLRRPAASASSVSSSSDFSSSSGSGGRAVAAAATTTSSWTSPAVRTGAKSSVEDPDCEVLWSAAAGDFSFFDGNAGEECGVSEAEMRRGAVPLEVRMGKMVVGDEEMRSMPRQRPLSTSVQAAASVPLGQERVVDTIAEISKFRKAIKALYLTTAGSSPTGDSFVEGYWDGDIIVIRK